jgi:raffinose/stachyose/melibiose transport system permease protein
MSATVISPAGPAPSAKPPRSHSLTWSLGTPFSYAAALLVVAISIVPLLYVILSGFRTTEQINANPVGLPHPWDFHTYWSIISGGMFWTELGNSTFIAVVATVLAVGLGSTAAFALSRYEFRGREAIFATFMVGLLFPASVASLPLYLLLEQIGLLENLFGVALPEAAFSLPVTILILRPFFRAVPADLEGAAAIDGCSRLGFFWRILLPLSRPALSTVAILAFITSWNAYLLPLLVFNDQNHFTLPLGVATFQSQYSQNTAAIFAFTALSMVPALAFFVFAERRIIGGLTGAIKA